MKIFQVISDSNIGGAGVLVERICRALGSEFEFTVVVPRGAKIKGHFEREEKKQAQGGQQGEKDGGRGTVRVIEMPMAKDKSFRAGDVERFRALFLREKPDVVHTHATLSARVGARLAGVENILSTRHCAKEREEKTSFLYRKVYNSVTDLTISTAMFAKQNLIDEGVLPEKIRVIYNGSPRTVRTSPKERAALKEHLGIPKGALVLGSVARLEVVKGQDLMIEALARLVREGGYEYRLVLVGEGSAEGMYRTLAQELGVGSRVHFVGFSDTPYLYQNIFDINLNASRGTETSCLATSECMSLGVVTVASDFGGNREMIRDGVTGLLFPTEDVRGLVGCIRRLADAPTLYLALSSGARLMYENTYSLERMAQGYREVYFSLGRKIR